MWLERPSRKIKFINGLLNLKGQALILRGARQVGKTSFILNTLQELNDYPQLKLNLSYPSSFNIDGVDYLGRDFFGRSPTGEEFLKNIGREFGDFKKLGKPALIFVDEADRYPPSLEAIQTLSQFSDKLKFIFTGSNLENIPVENTATGRKKYFDLYPITFREFIIASNDTKLLDYFDGLSLKDDIHSDFYHGKLSKFFDTYIRIGGMPRIMNAYLDPASEKQPIPEIAKDLAFSIEENVKTVLGDKTKLYEYEDILRKITVQSMNTLKYTSLQVQHAGRSEAKRLVSKTVGARVAHKIRLFESERDMSKYIIFDCGIANYLLSGSDLLRSTIADRNLAILHETYVGMEIISGLVTRDDLFYWKSGNVAEVEYLLRSPHFIGIDVKTGRGDTKSLNSLAIFEPEVLFIVKICDGRPSVAQDHIASLPNFEKKRKVPLVVIPHYLTGRLIELLEKFGR